MLLFKTLRKETEFCLFRSANNVIGDNWTISMVPNFIAISIFRRVKGITFRSSWIAAQEVDFNNKHYQKFTRPFSSIAERFIKQITLRSAFFMGILKI